MAKAQVEKAKEKAEKTRDKAKQHGYDFGMVEIEDTLRAEVPRVRRLYCAQVWDDALNQARVEASFVLRKAEISTTLKPSGLPPLGVIKQTSL